MRTERNAIFRRKIPSEVQQLEEVVSELVEKVCKLEAQMEVILRSCVDHKQKKPAK